MSQLMVGKHFLYGCLRIVKVSPDPDDTGVGSLLGNHLFFLDRAYPILGIKHHDPGSRYVREACKGCLARIAGGSRQDNDLFLHAVLLCRSRHQMGQNGKRHVLKGNGRSMKQLQEKGSVSFLKRSDLPGIEFAVIGPGNAFSQLCFRIIRQEDLHDLKCKLLIIKICQFRKGKRKPGDPLGHIQSPVISQPPQDRAGGRNLLPASSGTFV